MQDNDEEAEERTRIISSDSDATRVYDAPRRAATQSNKSNQPSVPTGVTKPDQGPGIALGTVIAQRFIVEQLLGHGGMSVVYRARDLEKVRAGDPNPCVAIKILRTNLTDNPDAVIALQRETKKGQMLAHPHIVTMHDFQTDPQLGLSFAQMEELHGYSLKQLIEKSPKGLKDKDKAISIILSIADGLEYAHKRGIVHSDLKPSNVFVTDDGQVKILDFGIARAMPGSDTDQFDAGSLGALTRGYATSEMFDREPPDPSDDIYALGVIAHQLLTGTHPYQEVLRESEPIKAAQKLELKPKRIKTLNRRQWHALASSLAYERSSRPPDAGVFLREFRRRSKTTFYLGIVLVVITGVLVYEWYTPDKLKPEIPFEELPITTRQAFNSAIEEGNTLYKFKDYNGALYYFSQAYELHPRNPVAMEGLDKIVKVVKSQKTDGTREQIESKLKAVQILLSNDSLAERGDLIKLEQSLQNSLINPVKPE